MTASQLRRVIIFLNSLRAKLPLFIGRNGGGMATANSRPDGPEPGGHFSYAKGASIGYRPALPAANIASVVRKCRAGAPQAASIGQFRSRTLCYGEAMHQGSAEVGRRGSLAVPAGTRACTRDRRHLRTVTSEAEGGMEGVVVTARKADASFRVSVVTDAQAATASRTPTGWTRQYALTSPHGSS